MDFANCGLEISELDLFGLLSSSDNDKLMGPEIPGRELDIEGLAACRAGSEDHAGIGGRDIPGDGDSASFFAGGWLLLVSLYS